jgi:hypothetical protein
MTVLLAYALVSPVLALVVVGVLMIVHSKQHARALRSMAELPDGEGAQAKPPRVRGATPGEEHSFAE